MYQKIIVVGNLGGDPEMRYMPSGNAVTNFSMATTTRKKDGEQWADETIWFRVSVWGKQAESCNQYLSKGRKVLVEGKLRGDPATGSPRMYQRGDGSWGASFEVTADTVKFLSSRGDDATAGQGFGEPVSSGYGGAKEQEDIPF